MYQAFPAVTACSVPLQSKSIVVDFRDIVDMNAALGQEGLLLIGKQNIAAQLQLPQTGQPLFVRKQLLECLVVRCNADFDLVS